MAAFLYPLYASVNIGLALWGMNSYEQDHEVSTILLIIILLGMTYDNLVIFLGRSINEGKLLKSMNFLRFVLHSLFIPLLVVTAVNIAGDAGVTWAKDPIMLYANWIIASVLMTLGLIPVLQQELVPINFGGTMRYKPQKSDIPVSTIITAILVAVAGSCIWNTRQWPWMLIGTLFMLAGNALPKNLFGTLVSSAVDSVFMLAVLTTALMVH